MRRRQFCTLAAGIPLLAAGQVWAQGAPALTGAACAVPRPAGATKVSLLAYRFAAMEYLSAAIRACGGGTLEVDARLVSFSALLEQSNIFLASGGESPYDLLHTYNTLMWEQASKGWLRPLDDLAAQHAAAVGVPDLPPSILEACGYDGKLYGLPFQQTVLVLFANTELLDKAGAAPPTTTAELLAAGAKLKGTAGLRAPLALALGGTAGAATEFHNALMSEGGTWLDPDNRPAFRSDKGEAALDLLRGLIALCPANALSMSNDDAQVAMQQGQVAMTNLWITRAAQMDDRTMSRVGGKVQFFPAPKGPAGIPYSSFTVDMVAVPKNAPHADLAFQVLADALRPDRERGLAPLTMVPRTSLMQDAALNAPLRWIPAGAATLQAGAKPAPRVPFFSTLREVVGRALQEGLQGNQPTKDILANAETAAARMLKEQGHLKG